MKMVIAVIKPFKLDDVRSALNEIGIEGMTITEVKGFGRQKGQKELYGGSAQQVNFLPKIKIEVAIPDMLEDKVILAIQNSANTGRIGDGKIFVYEMSQAVRIRTGDRDEAAL